MKQFEIIQELLEQARPHNLELECIVTMINFLVPFATEDDLKKACDEAFCQWDL